MAAVDGDCVDGGTVGALDRRCVDVGAATGVSALAGVSAGADTGVVAHPTKSEEATAAVIRAAHCSHDLIMILFFCVGTHRQPSPTVRLFMSPNRIKRKYNALAQLPRQLAYVLTLPTPPRADVEPGKGA